MSFGALRRASLTKCICSIIAVTGLAGHAFGSWKARGSSYMWLRDFLPHEIPNVRVLVYGYDTKLPGSQSTASIAELSRKFLESVKTIRKQKEVSLLVHTLCGIGSAHS